jgi:hypothetical protein
LFDKWHTGDPQVSSQALLFKSLESGSVAVAMGVGSILSRLLEACFIYVFFGCFVRCVFFIVAACSTGLNFRIYVAAQGDSGREVWCTVSLVWRGRQEWVG